MADGAWHVERAGEMETTVPEALRDHSRGLTCAVPVGRHVGAVHTGIGLYALEPEGELGTHLHSNEQSFYVLEGRPRLTLDGRTYALEAGDCGLIPLGVPHGWSTGAGEGARWYEATAPVPRLSGPPDTFFTDEPLPNDESLPLDIRDPRTHTFFRLGRDDLDLDKRKAGAAVDAPTVSASMATALLAYSGIALKMLVDGRLGAALHQLFMVEYQPGAVAHLHDHPLEESYFVLEGEVEATADDQRFVLGPGDIFWTGVGCIHSFVNTSDGLVRFLETQSPQPPVRHSYRFSRDWDYLSDRLGGE